MYFDPYEFDVLSARGINKHTLKQVFPKELKVRIEVAPQLQEADQGLQHFLMVTDRAKPGWVYLSSAHPFDSAELSSRFPGIRIIIEAPRPTGRANQIALVYDRERANFEAGKAIAQLLEDQDFLDRLGAGEETLSEGIIRVGILLAVRNEKVEREISAFREGFSTLGAPERIERKDVGNLTDRVKARRLLDGMKEASVVIFVLKTYVLSGFCMEYLAKEGGLAVVDEPAALQAYGDTVLLILADDILAAMEGISEHISQDAEQNGTGLITAPVRLQWNEIYKSTVTQALEGTGRQ